MTMLVTLDEMKTYLGIPLVDTSSDDFLNREITLISDTVEEYCDRSFHSNTYVETIYYDDYKEYREQVGLHLFHYPCSVINSVKEVTVSATGTSENLLTASDVRLHKDTARIQKQCLGRKEQWFDNCFDYLEVDYDAGYASIPEPIRSVVFSLVAERYNKDKNGIDVNFGSDVQRVSIPGTIAVDYDYSLRKNERESAFGMILGDYLNVIDKYRSERSAVGDIREKYVN